MLKSFYQKYNVYLIAMLVSMVLSMLILVYRQPFNIDGAVYLSAAAGFLKSGLHGAIKIYNWPFYSILIAWFSKYLHLSLLSSAYLLDGVLDVIIVVTFIMLSKSFWDSRLSRWIAAFVILFFPYFAHMRGDIMRGHGYFAFALLSFWFFIQYARTKQWRYAINWNIAIMFATLFRIEGAALMMLVPLSLLFLPNTNYRYKCWLVIKAYILPIMALFFLGSYFLFFSHYTITNVNHVRATEIINQMLYGFQHAWQSLQYKAQLIKQHVLPDTAKGSNYMFLWGGLFGMYVANFLGAISIGYFLLSVYGFIRHRKSIFAEVKLIWIAFVIINLFVTALFLFQMSFLVSRYLVLLSMCLLLTVPLAIESIYVDWKYRAIKQNYSKSLLLAVFLMLIYTFLGSVLHFGASKTYIIEAGNWVSQNTPQGGMVSTNDGQTHYYLNRAGAVKDTSNLLKDLNQGKFLNYQHVVFKVNRHEGQLTKQLFEMQGLKFLRAFKNKKGDQALIFEVVPKKLL